MKYYDTSKIKELIEKHKENLTQASLGMHEDWFWTAETVWEGEYTKDIDDGKSIEIGGIDGSTWATPTLQLVFKSGEEKMIEVSRGKNNESGPPPVVRR